VPITPVLPTAPITAHAHTDPSHIRNIIKQQTTNQANLRFADEETLQALLGVKRGAVSALAVLNDTEKQVTLAVDKALLDQATVNVHPLRNDRTVAISAEALLKVGCAFAFALPS